ncbi:elongation factor 4 [Candidatus Giovannonibacteria bacterium]|nr:elongation factor 4 [Candidatus Giovannonibacteria bacterium]
MANIRNFCIIAHIDHGKSTLADRMLELTHTIEQRKMREQFLDMHPLERERGITIKMQPVRMEYHAQLEIENSNSKYILNLIDTPGHIDFNYEVSRALAAVEGAVLLVDATQGVEAQTLSNVELARQLNLAIIPVINKIDLPGARIAETKKEIVNILNCAEEDILLVSARTGEGVGHLLEEIVRRMPPPRNNTESTLNIAEEPRALIFDYEYSIHRGVIAHVRVFEGEIKKGDRLKFFQAKEDFIAGEVGIFKPELKETEKLSAGEIGYVITNAKEANIVRVGDTIIKNSNSSPLPGYKEIKPVVFSSVYPMNQNEFPDLKKALEKIRLIDSAFSFEEESAGVLGRGFRCGFLGMLHLEIVSERIFRDYGIKTIVATPTVKYKIKIKKGGEQKEIEIYTPSNFPERHEILEILEPYLKLEILMPPEKLPNILKLLQEHEAILGETHKFSESRIRLSAEMPLRELMRNFFDELKSFSSGYASLNYEFIDSRPADLLRLDILVNEEAIPAFARIVPKKRVEHEAEEAVEKLYKILPHALFALKIQAKADGRIISARSLKALSKDVTGHLYGGDRTRKMKLWQKQKKGKKRLKERADFEIPHDVYLKMIKK